MNKIRIGVYSVKRKGKRASKDVGYIRFRLKDDSSDPVPMNVDKGNMYIRTWIYPGYTTYTYAFEDSLDYYMTYSINNMDLTLIEIYEIYTL